MNKDDVKYVSKAREYIGKAALELNKIKGGFGVEYFKCMDSQRLLDDISIVLESVELKLKT